MSCTHSDEDAVMRIAGPVSAGYCRVCGSWRLGFNGQRATGAGPDSFRELVDQLAEANPQWAQRSALFLRDMPEQAFS